MTAVLSGFWQCWLLFALGSLVVSRYRQSLRLGEEVALSVGLGTVITSALIFLLLLAGIFQPVAVVSVFLLLTLISARRGEYLARRVRTALWEAIRANPVLSAVAFVLLIPHFLSGMTPEVEVDSLWYHLGVPQFYLIRERLCEVPFCLPSHYPMNFHLQYVFSLLIGNDETAKIVVVFLFLPICALIYSLTRQRSDRKTALFAVILYLSMIHHRLPVMANVKSAVLLFSLLSTMFLWQWMEEKRESDFWISAFWCGIAIGTKFNALIFCLLLHTAVVFLWMAYQRNWRDAILRPVGYHAVGWTLLSPWMIKSYLYTGNPLYPLLSGLFGACEGYLQAMLSNDLNHGLNITRSETIGQYCAQVWHNIHWMTFNTDLIFFLIPVGLLLLVIEWRRFAPQILTGVV
ncbi:MAG TPA: glycosyltransferase family 39 protein, partial [bacterium]|nr:glycosyltransferase family 39 protein [bacterium]